MRAVDKPVAALDACVLYPAPLRDLLLNAADFRLFTPKWTAQIQAEWTRNLLLNRPELAATQLQRTTAAMQAAFPEAEVHDYEPLIASLQLPGPDDRHVLAAAMQAPAAVIVTANLKDFPPTILPTYGVKAQHSDRFMSTLLQVQPERMRQAFQQQVSFLRSPQDRARSPGDAAPGGATYNSRRTSGSAVATRCPRVSVKPADRVAALDLSGSTPYTSLPAAVCTLIAEQQY